MEALFAAHPLYAYALSFVVLFGAVSFVVLLFISAPYGRHVRDGWGPVMPARLAWVLMEAPSPIGCAYVFVRFAGYERLVPTLYAHLNPMTYKDAARMEKQLAEELRARGFQVFGGT